MKIYDIRNYNVISDIVYYPEIKGYLENNWSKRFNEWGLTISPTFYSEVFYYTKQKFRKFKIKKILED